MIFGDVIKEIVTKTDGCIGGIIMDVDGIPLESFKNDDADIDLQMIGIEFANIIREVSKATQTLESGDLNEITINASEATVVLRNLASGYFLALVLKDRGMLGKARYLARVAAPKLVNEL